MSTKKPNVVLMLSDNIGYGDIGAFQGGEIRGIPTPNIDSIAHEGITLTQCLVEAACTPSRAALMTGQYSPRSGLGSVIIGGTPTTRQPMPVKYPHESRVRNGYGRQMPPGIGRTKLANQSRL